MDVLIDLYITDATRRQLLARRLGIADSGSLQYLSEWLEHSSLPPRLSALLLRCFIEPGFRSPAHFQQTDLRDIVDYVRQSHRFYNGYYMCRMEQFSECLEHRGTSGSAILCERIQDFLTHFRQHLSDEETVVLPYIEFLMIQRDRSCFSPAECFALTRSSRIADASHSGAEEYAMLDDMLREALKLCKAGRFDIQWEPFRRLITEFRTDLRIHEFIEDEVLLHRAARMEKSVLEELRRISRLN